MKKIKKYYRIEFQLTSPLSVGSGENYITDKDIIKDSRGIPYIPGTSLAGIYRSLFSKKTAETYFGPELTQERIQESAEQWKKCIREQRGCHLRRVSSGYERSFDYKAGYGGSR